MFNFSNSDTLSFSGESVVTNAGMREYISSVPNFYRLGYSYSTKNNDFGSEDDTDESSSL